MSDAMVKRVPTPVTKSKDRKTAAGGIENAKKHAVYPKYTKMVEKPIEALNERGDRSCQVIHQYIMSHVDKHTKVVDTWYTKEVKLALKRVVQAGIPRRSKGTGATCSSRRADKAADEPQNFPVKHGHKKARAPNLKKVAKPKAAKSFAENTAEPMGPKAAAPKTAAGYPKYAKKPVSEESEVSQEGGSAEVNCQ